MSAAAQAAPAAVPDEALERKTARLFAEHQLSIFKRTDHIFAGLMIFQWIAGIAAALFISPRTWSGAESQTHLHVWMAILFGGVVTALPVAFIVAQPGKAVTRHVVAAGQVFMSALLI